MLSVQVLYLVMMTVTADILKMSDIGIFQNLQADPGAAGAAEVLRGSPTHGQLVVRIFCSI